MKDTTAAFLKAVYKGYYFRHAASIEFPGQIEQREFGYIPFGGGMVRHLSFKKTGEAVAEIVRQAPSSVYCSNARYESPALPMESKGWKGAELIFDIDATDIPTGCKKSHDTWYCDKCGSAGRLPKPGACPACGGQTAEFHGTCPVCLEAAKEHTLRTMGFLTADFGVKRSDIQSYFSGSRGYHLHVFDRKFEPLDQQGRSEIAEYILGASLPSSQTVAAILRRTPPEDRKGWFGRLSTVVAPGKEGTHSIARLVASEAARIDASVTTDIHRVFRLAGTLHGTTGMLKTRADPLESFDPAERPVVLAQEPVRLTVKSSPRLFVKGEWFGPFKSGTVSVPTFAAIGILTRGFGEVA